jgi:glyoxylase-like metal-dependent hydrolase (beta-lactamase superfamily II)
VLLRETFPAGPFQCNCSILACGDSKDAIVVDPGGELERIAEIVAHYDLTVRAIIHTHAHLDHIVGTRDVKQAHGGTICLHRDDLFLYDGAATQAGWFGWPAPTMLPVERFIEDGERVDFGKLHALVLHTPGHTPGSVCFEVSDPDAGTLMLSGDTLFRRSVGRTDLPGGHGPTLLRSIRDKLYVRDPDAVVIPGHGPTTTLGDEARANPFVKAT